MKNKISSNDILIIRNTIISSGHDNEQKRVQGQKVYVSLEREGERWNRENKNIFFRGIWLGRRKGFHAHFPRIYFTCTCKYYIIKAGPCARVYSSNDEHIYIYRQMGRRRRRRDVRRYSSRRTVLRDGRIRSRIHSQSFLRLRPDTSFHPLLLSSPQITSRPTISHSRTSVVNIRYSVDYNNIARLIEWLISISFN